MQDLYLAVALAQVFKIDSRHLGVLHPVPVVRAADDCLVHVRLRIYVTDIIFEDIISRGAGNAR